ncbi:RnfABCDGE type electron transport complex subunit G [Thermodesulfobacteriota bacterium]
MREIIKLFLVVAIFGAVAGGVLASVREATLDTIESQVWKYVTGPAIEELFKGCTNNPKEDKFNVQDGEEEIKVFVAEYDGKRNIIAFETSGKGFDGKIGVMVGFDLEKDELLGMRVTTHTETPGIGSRAKTETGFIEQFNGMSVDSGFTVRSDGGDIDAMSGATVTSKGVSSGIADSVEKYKRLKEEILNNM